MVATGLYVLAAVGVLASLLRGDQRAFGLLTLGIIALAWGVHALAERWSRTRLSVVCGVVLAAMLVATVRLSGLGWGPALVAVGAVALAFVIAGGHLGTILAVVIGAVPTTALLLGILLQDAGSASWVPLQIMLWSLAAWPAVALITSGRRWLVISALGVAGLLFAIHRILARTEHVSLRFLEVPGLGEQRLEALLAIGQTLLVIACVSPHLALSAPRWRWTALAGLLGILGPLLLVIATGPWPQGWPALTWWLVVPASVLLTVGIVGMLCTVRQAEAMAEHAVRAMALGMGATASLLLPILEGGVDPRELLPALTAAVAPLAWGLGLALVLALTGLIARRGDEPLHTTTLLRLKVRPKLRSSLVDAARVFGQDLRREASSWATPRGIVPLIVLAATWPAFASLGASTSLVPLLVLPAVAGVGLIRRSLLAWTCFQGLLLLAAACLFGLDGPVAFAAAALGLVAAYPFLRWHSLHPGWAFSAGLLVQVLMWEVLGGREGELMVAALAFGIAVLLNNALVPGGARGPMLVITGLWLLAFLGRWIPQQDPYFPLLLRDRSLVAETLELLVRLPVLALVLITLWVSRHRLAVSQWRSTRAQRWLLGLSGIAAAALWASGIADHWLVGLAAWVLLALCFRTVGRELADSHVLDEREPLIDATSLVIAVLIVAAGRSAALVTAADSGSGIEPGALGAVLIDAVRDLIALALATTIPVAIGLTSNRSGLVHRTRMLASGLRTAARRLTRRELG